MVMEDHDEMCALCGKRARMLCESDQAKLCWDCDRSVHGANFLVAKHVRVLLCRLCHSPTPWKASGPSLTPTSSICHRCVPTTTQSPSNNHHHHHHVVHDDESYDDDDEEEEEEESDEGEDDDEEEEEGENQVVPWSSSPAAPSEVVGGVGSSTNTEDNEGDMSSNTASRVFPSPFNLKRFPRNNIHHSYDDEDDIGCSSSEGLANDESSSMSMFRPFKQPRRSQREAAQWHNQRWGKTPTAD